VKGTTQILDAEVAAQLAPESLVSEPNGAAGPLFRSELGVGWMAGTSADRDDDHLLMLDAEGHLGCILTRAEALAAPFDR
jgi:hypothetical protein